MDPAATASLSGELPLPSVQGAAASYCVDLSVDASVLPAVPPSVAEAEAARTGHEEEENAAIRLVHLLVTCANDIQAGDYAAATGNLAEARLALGTTVSTATGIGRVTSHFAAALGQRLSRASPSDSGAAPDAASSAAKKDRHIVSWSAEVRAIPCSCSLGSRGCTSFCRVGALPCSILLDWILGTSFVPLAIRSPFPFGEKEAVFSHMFGHNPHFDKILIFFALS
jgi:hypothetical protein